MKQPKTEAELMALADQKLDEMEKKDEVKMEEATNLFRRADIVEGASKTYRVEVPELKGFFTFRKLTWNETKELNKIKESEDKALKTIALMVKKANPDLDVEAILSTMSVDFIGLMSQRMEAVSNAFLQEKK